MYKKNLINHLSHEIINKNCSKFYEFSNKRLMRFMKLIISQIIRF